MAIRCANCRGYFSQDEITRGKPPGHPWPITPAGAKVIGENLQRSGDQWPCPACGHRALVL
jgi:DNA-directed RNA polymerase subunit RPC12/RpoP